MHAGYWGAVCGGAGAADCVVEDEDALGALDVLEEDGFDFWVVVVLHTFVVGKVFLGGRRCMKSGEGVGVEIEGAFLATDVVDGDGYFCVAEVSLRLAFWGRFDVVEGLGAVGGWFVEV